MTAMHTLLNKLSHAWLILAIVTAPLQALAFPVSVDSLPDCDMHVTAQSDKHAHHQVAVNAAADPAAPHCAACSDQGCDSGGCSDHTCFTSQAQQSLFGLESSLTANIGNILLPAPDRTLTSLTLSPLDRPPSI